MNVLNEMSDEEFIPFLQSLGVETYKKSFEWMLNDQDFAGVLRWLHQNLDHNNALSAREEYRYAEIEKQGQLLSPEDLESYIAELQKEYQGLCLPGDKEGQEDLKSEIDTYKDRLHMLQKHDAVVQDLLKQNEQTREDLNQEVTKLHSVEQQCCEDESTAADESLQLAAEVDDITEEVVVVLADTLDLYSNCSGNKDMSKKFFTFGPFDLYRQKQALFRSHFDLYTSKKFNRHKDNVTDEDLRTALVEAKSMEERLTDAALAYIEATAELSGEQAKLTLVANYNNVHPSQITACSMEAQSASELLDQEEAILEQQLHAAVAGLVHSRTTLAAETTARKALAVREQLHTDLSHLLDTTELALGLDRVLYGALRHELRTLEDLVQFAAQLRQYVVAEAEAVGRRIESMNQITTEQEACEQKLQSTDSLTPALSEILGVPANSDASTLMKAHSDLTSNIVELKDLIAEAFRRKEGALDEFLCAAAPLRALVFAGGARRAHGRDGAAGALAHALRQAVGQADRRVLAASGLYTHVKNGDKNMFRKLWQWFLTDPAKLPEAVMKIQGMMPIPKQSQY